MTTAPSVIYRVRLAAGGARELHNPADLPDPTRIALIEEPWIRATVFVPDDYLGAVLRLCEDRRGAQLDLTWVGRRAMAVYRLPLNEVVFDFHDRLKSVSRGYASFDYELDGYAAGDLVKVADPGERRGGGEPRLHGPPRPRRRRAGGPCAKSSRR